MLVLAGVATLRCCGRYWANVLLIRSCISAGMAAGSLSRFRILGPLVLGKMLEQLYIRSGTCEIDTVGVLQKYIPQASTHNSLNFTRFHASSRETL